MGERFQKRAKYNKAVEKAKKLKLSIELLRKTPESRKDLYQALEQLNYIWWDEGRIWEQAESDRSEIHLWISGFHEQHVNDVVKLISDMIATKCKNLELKNAGPAGMRHHGVDYFRQALVYKEIDVPTTA